MRSYQTVYRFTPADNANVMPADNVTSEAVKCQQFKNVWTNQGLSFQESPPILELLYFDLYSIPTKLNQ